MGSFRSVSVIAVALSLVLHQAYDYIVAQVVENVNTFFRLFYILANILWSYRGEFAG